MTPIEQVPQLRLSSRFPTNADRPSGQWNAVVVEWGETTRVMATDLNLLAQSVLNNATAGREQAQAAQASNDAAKEQADRSRDEANRSRDEAELSMGYRNTAGQHAGAAATHAGTAATKAGEAAASAQLAGEHKQQALQAVADAQGKVALASQQAARAETAAASIADGPITSLQVHTGLKTGAVTLGLEDLADKATDQQMQQGAELEPLLMSPAGVKAAVLAHAPKTLVCEARAANAQLVKADSGKLIDITSGTFTQTFAAAATLGGGWWCYLKNSGTGDITLDPNAAELIDGLTSYIMYPGEVRLVQCDGLALRTLVITPYFKAFTTSGTYKKPPGYRVHAINAWKGGVAGRSGGVTTSNSSSTVAQGGAGSSLYEAELPDSAVPTTVSVTIGSGGVAAEASTSDNRPGPSSAPGDTAFGDLLSTASWVSSLVTSTGFPTVAGRGGDSGVIVDSYSATTNHLGLPGTSTATSAGGKGGDSAYKVQQSGAIFPATPGEDGVAPGGGGGGGSSSSASSWATKPPAQKGGNGARGELRIWGII